MSLFGTQLEREIRKRRHASSGASLLGAAASRERKTWQRRGELLQARYADVLPRSSAAEGACRTPPPSEHLVTVPMPAGMDAGTGTEPVGTQMPPREDVVRRLSETNEPVIAYDESERDNFIRLCGLEAQARSQDLEYGQRRAAEERAEAIAAEEEDEIEQQGTDSKPTMPRESTGQKRVQDIPVEPQDIIEPRMNRETFVLAWMHKLLSLWVADIRDHAAPTATSAPSKVSYKERQAHDTLVQTREYLEPFIKRLEARKLAESMLEFLFRIFEQVQQREYVQANDVYLRLAIGNAPWPVGATQVGIHSRAAREKIGEENVAHVMNDEQTRKFVQAVKRLITRAQKYFPTVPSKMVQG